MKRMLLTIYFFLALIILANAGQIYSCIDHDGNKIVTDHIEEGMKKCVPIEAFSESPQREQQFRMKVKEQSAENEYWNAKREREAKDWKEQKESEEKHKNEQEAAEKIRVCRSECSSSQNSCNDSCERNYGHYDRERDCRKSCSDSYDLCLYNKCKIRN